MSSISFIIPTIGRKSLKRTLASIDAFQGDQVIVVGWNPPSGKWGNPERNEGMTKATGDYLAFTDDDDYYVTSARDMMGAAIEESGGGVPIMFRMQYPNGEMLWKEKEVVAGNIGTPMFLVPNDRDKLHTWEGARNMADVIFCQKWKWRESDIVWREEVIALLGHDYENR